MEIFCQPNLPINTVNKVILSGEYGYIINELNNLGIETITTTPHSSLPYFERYHADMQCSYFSKGNILINNTAPLFVKNLTNSGVKVNFSDLPLKSQYPYNTALNHIIIDDKYIGNIKYTHTDILNFCKENHYNIINVKQGYTKCSTAIVNSNALITADNGIYKACTNAEIDVLKIDCGYINLYGYNYGFIGGCCGKLSKNILAFTGKVSQHKNYSDIKCFLHNYKIDILELSNKPLVDIGSIIPLTEIVY